ncbi:armadillo-type protein [Mycena rosella]|uniref:Armadillo-type protein n=1 Tax=Mycena rosella TaxID=1033263 RepID=A0AAD7MCD1_MYCRO|nr:armadillo-type protein [Mycena rosella]
MDVPPLDVPPTDHVLRPHHVGLLTLFILTFKEFEGKLPPTFLLHIYRVLLNEVVEVAPPKTFAELYTELGAGPKSEDDYPRQLIESFEACRNGLSSAEEMTNFFAGLPSLFVEKTEGEEDATTTLPPTLLRRSVFGYFCRRCFVSFLKLSFYGVGKLQKEYEAWCGGVVAPTVDLPIIKDQLHSDTHIFRTIADKTVWAQPNAYELWEKSLATGDESIATESLRRYFEQHFHEQNDSGFRHHALLNLVRMHYLRQEYVAARKLLSEAIGVARSSNDKAILQHCISMLHRLPPTIERRRPMLNEIQADLHPLEVLFDVYKLMDEENGQPLSASFAKITQGMGLYDHWFDTRPVAPPDTEQWAQHAVQSVVWSAAGCDRLAVIEENLVMAFTDLGGEDNNRITVILNQAYREARQGKYETSLSALLQPSVWRGLSLVDYSLWAQEVWHVLVLRATRRGQDRAYREILLPRRPPGEFKPRHYSLTPSGLRLSKIHDPLWDVIQMRHCDQATSAIDGLLTALWHSEFLGRLNLYRTGIILLADVGLDYGMSKRSRRILEDIMPQIIAGQDLEQLAFACFTLARCIIVAGESTAEALTEAVPYLIKSEQGFLALEMHRAVMDVQYFLSVVYHNCGLQLEREEAVKRHFATQEMRRELETSDQGICEVLEVHHVLACSNKLKSKRHHLSSSMDGPPPVEEDFSTLPVAERLSHKNWKARVNGYETLVKIFQATGSDADPAFRPYINNPDLLKKIATDSNAVAQEKGVESLVALVKYAGESATKTRDAVVPALVDKCFGSTRAGTKTQAVELALQYVEVENGGAGVVTDILPGLSAKQPKTVAGCVLALKEIIRLFGIQTTPPPPILKALPKIFSHSDKTVRAEGTLLTHVLYQYLGPGIEPWLADLKPVQVKELKEAFDAMEAGGTGKGTVKPERLTRAHAREVEAAGDDGEAAAESEEEAAPLDPRAFAEPVDVKLPSSLQTLLTSSKWKERKEVLDELLTLLNSTPRIKDGPEISEVAKSLAVRIQSDANINCVMTAAACIEALAKAMLGSFARYREAVVAPMLERLKERKATVTDSIGDALDAVFSTTTLADIIPDLGTALGSKNPQVKEGTLKFLGRSLSTASSPIQPAQIKPLAETLAVLLEDGFEGARTEAATCLGTLMKMVGERPLNPVMEGLPDMRKAKVKEAFERATVKCKSGASAPPKPPPPPAAAPAPKKKAPVAKATVVEDESPPKKAVTKPPAKPPAKKPTAPVAGPSSAAPVKKAPAASTAKPSKVASSAPAALDTFKYRHTPEDAEALASETIPPAILKDLADANWKTRLTALDEMTGWVEGVMNEVDAEVVVRALAKKGWAEKNFQVSAKIYGICALLAEQCPSFGRSCPALCVAHLSEKLGDLKLKKPAGDTLLVFAEKTSLQFVLNQAYEPLSKQKAPKVLADAVTWINTALLEFGIAGLALRSLIEFLKTALQNSNAAVRTSATKTLVTVKLFAGSSIKDFLEDLNAQLLNTITAEFDKVEGNPAPEPTRTSADLASIVTSSATSNGGGTSGDPLDELFPRVEVDGLLKGTTILADSKSDSWKTKKEALEGFQSILDQGSNKRLKSSMGDIGQVLKARVTDTNKAVQTLALDIVSRIATGMGKPFEKHSRLFVLPVATVLSDQKAPIRAAAIQTLTAIATACEGLDSMVQGLHTALETTNPLQKGTLLHWIADWFREHEPAAGLDLTSWTAPIVTSLDDRNSDVRKGAQALLPTLIACVGFDHVIHQTNSLKPASRTSAVPLIQAARPAVTQQTAPQPKANALPAPVSAPPTSVSPPPESPTTSSAPIKTGSKLGVRRKLPPGSSRPDSRAETPVELLPSRSSKTPVGGLRRPGGVGGTAKASAPSTPPPSLSLPFSGTNTDAKKSRLAKDASKWINEGGLTRKDLAELLQTQMEPYASKELMARLFSHDHNAVNDYISGLTTMCDLFSSAQGADASIEAVCLANFDLPLKYASMKLHEPQPNLVSKCLEVVETVLAFLRSVNYQLTDNEALCFIPTVVYKLGDGRETVRARVQQIIQELPRVYAYSRVFQILLDHGLKSKVAKTRQGALDEMGGVLKKSGMGACEPSKAFPIIAGMISDKDLQVRKSALGALGEGYALVGEKVWSLVGPLSPKDKTQLEERLRRVAGPSNQEAPAPPAQVSRIAAGIQRPGSPATTSRIGGIPRPASPSVMKPLRSASPAPSNLPRAASPVRTSRVPITQSAVPSSPTTGIGRPKTMLPSRLGLPRPKFPSSVPREAPPDEPRAPSPKLQEEAPELNTPPEDSDDITITISSILSSDPTRSVEALKKIQKILAVGPDAGPSSPQYRELAEHTEGLIETITLQMAHVFDRPEDLVPEENFRLAKHLIQTLNTFCDHAFLAESLTVDILTSLLEELTLRLLETDDSTVKKVKDLSRFINMIVLRLFATGRRMSIFRALFALLLQIVKPFPVNGTAPDSKESKVAELVLKCVWKLARNIPQDLTEERLDPVELFPAIEHFLQSVPPNEWRARATNKVPCGDMPLRTIKVIIQHVVAFYGDDVYDLLSASFDDPSATIVYPYVYRILNSTSRPASEMPARQNGGPAEQVSPASSRPISPQEAASVASGGHRHSSSPSHRTSPSSSSHMENGTFAGNAEEPDPDAQLLVIIGHISSETTGALHKEGITELHHFLKAHPHKRPRVEKMLESTGAAFRKYINRALASRAAEDQERDVAVADTLSKLESNHRPASPHRAASPHRVASPHRAASPHRPTSPPPPQPRSPRQTSPTESVGNQDKLSRLHNLFQYRSSTQSNGSSAPRTSLS